MNSVTFAINDELSPDETRAGCLGGPSDPKFHGFFGGRIDDELLVLMVVMSLSPDAFNVGAMKQLS